MGTTQHEYRVVISTSVQEDTQAVEEQPAQPIIAASRPWWRRLFTKPAPKPPTQIEYKDTGSSFAEKESAIEHALQIADGLAHIPNSEVAVVVLDLEDNEVGGFWTGGGGSI